MNTLYALVYSVCLQSGECVSLTPEVYTDMSLCVREAIYQRNNGASTVYCEEIREDEELFAEK